MYSPAGLEFWEIVAVSAMCAVGMLTLASIIGATVGYLFFREPKVVRHALAVPAAASGETATIRTGYVSPAAG
jgi:hypothetical protein